MGIVIGTAIFRMPGTVFRSVDSPLTALGLWLAGGVLTLCGAFCYSELAAAYPRSGGDYEYLSRAYGRWLGLQFAWAQLLVVLTGSVGSMAFAFADYARAFWSLPDRTEIWLAVSAVAGLTLTNLLGLRTGKTAQNLLTTAKLVGLAAIVLLAAWGPHWPDVRSSSPAPAAQAGLAMVFILYAYSGWTHAAYVAADVESPQRSLPRALLTGVTAVTTVYLVVNLAYLAILGLEPVRASQTPAFDAVLQIGGPPAARLVSLLVMCSALGAINGTILTGAHVLRELGRDYSGLRWLVGTGAVGATPVRALLAQGAVALGLVLAVGTARGRGSVDALITRLGLPAVPWETYFGGFETLVAAAAPLFWVFQLLTGTTVLLLRWKDPERVRPFRVPGYPLTVFVFIGACGYMLWQSVSYAQGLTLIAVIPVGSALLISWRGKNQQTTRVESD